MAKLNTMHIVCNILVFLGCFVHLKGALPDLRHPDDPSLRFIVMGDWGGLPDFPYRTPIEKAVAGEMGKISDYLDSQFVLTLGDNFYFDGVKDVYDKRFQETYDSVFTAKSLMRNWYLVAGNHDWHGNVSAQIDYSRHNPRWKYPALYYPLTFTVPGPSNQKVDVIMIDTVVLCGDSDAELLQLQPMTPKDPQKAEKQWAWIEKSLRNSKAEYLIVAGHYPVYSVAEHGPTKCLLQRLEPMLHKFHVSAYFCGHEHNIEHLEYKDTQYNTTVQYFISGAANFIDPSLEHEHDVPANSLRYHWANILSLGAFSYVETTEMNMTYTFIEANGKVLYQKVLFPRKI